MSIRRLFWLGAAILFTVAALVAIAAVLGGNFGKTQEAILETCGIAFVCGAATLAGFASVDRDIIRPVGWAAVAVGVASFAVWTGGVWKDSSSDAYWKIAAILGTWTLAALVVTTVRLLAASPRLVSTVVPATSAAAVLAAVVSTGMILADDGSLWRLEAVLVILTVLGYALTPALQRFWATAETLPAAERAPRHTGQRRCVRRPGRGTVGDDRLEPHAACLERRDRPPRALVSSSVARCAMTLELRSARALSPGVRTELFNAAYEGYLVPMHVDEAMVAVMDEVFDLDVDASRIALRDGVPVGIGNLGLRGEDAWIGGVGVVPSARRQGIGEALMEALHEQARKRAARRVWLEVIVENAAAFALYEKLGYRTVRDVDVWSLPLSSAEEPPVQDVSAAEAHARIRGVRTNREPWQRADETLAHYADARGLATDGGAAVYRQPGEHVQLVQIGGEDELLLQALRTLGPVSVLNLPADEPAADALRDLGGSVAIRQHEMLLEL